MYCTRSLKSGTTATMVGGPKEFGGTKGMFTVFFRIFGRLFWSSQNLYSVPSNSVYGPPKIIVLSPQIPFIVPQKSLFCPLLLTNHCSHQNPCYVPSDSTYPESNSVYSPPKILFCPLWVQIIGPPKNHCFVPSNSKSLFCPLKSVYGHFKIIVLSPSNSVYGDQTLFWYWCLKHVFN